MDIALARFNMIEQQIRPWNVRDPAVFSAMDKVPRERFVPTHLRNLAFADLELPLGHGVAMWTPRLEARALQSLHLEKNETALEIGTGSGYFAALLASQCQQVTTVEIVPALVGSAHYRLDHSGCASVEVCQGDGSRGWRDKQYDAVVLSCSVPTEEILMQYWFPHIATGGRLFAVVGELPVMQARCYTHTPAGIIKSELFDTVLPPFQGGPKPSPFVF